MTNPMGDDVEFLLAVIVMLAAWAGFGFSVTLYRYPRRIHLWFFAGTFYLALAIAGYLFVTDGFRIFVQ